MNNQHQIQNYYFLVKVNPIIYNDVSINQKSSFKQFKICIFKGTEKLSQQKIKINNFGQLYRKDNKSLGCYFSLLNYIHRRPVQCIIKFFEQCSQNQQKLIFQHKLYSYQLVNNFITKNQSSIKETIKTGFETEFLIQTFIQCTKEKLQQLVQSQKQNQISIKVSQQKDSQKSSSNRDNIKDFSLLMPEQRNLYISKTQSSTPAASFKLRLFESFADEQQNSKMYRPRFFSKANNDQNLQFWNQKKYSSIITTQPQYEKVREISTEMDRYIGYHLQNQVQIRSNHSKMSFCSSKKSKNTIVRSFKKNKTVEQNCKIVESPITQDQISVGLQSQMQNELQNNWQDQSKKTKIYYIGLFFVFFGLLYYLLADGGNEIYNKKKLKKKKIKILQ